VDVVVVVVVVGCSCDPVTFGYKSVDEYYFEASSCRSIKDVRVPLLCVQVRYTLSGDGQHFVKHIDHLALNIQPVILPHIQML
jgi:hypothetical protein